MMNNLLDANLHDLLTIDFYVKLTASSLLNPFFWLCFVLTRWAYIPNDQSKLAERMLLATIIIWVLHYISERVAWGGSRKVDWAQEVIVITGGSSGLGRVIADTYSMRGISVAVLDVKPMSDQDETEARNIRWYACDVGSQEAIVRAKEQIEKDVGRLSDISASMTFAYPPSETDRQFSSSVHPPSSSTTPAL